MDFQYVFERNSKEIKTCLKRALYNLSFFFFKVKNTFQFQPIVIIKSILSRAIQENKPFILFFIFFKIWTTSPECQRRWLKTYTRAGTVDPS